MLNRVVDMVKSEFPEAWMELPTIDCGRFKRFFHLKSGTSGAQM